MKALPAGIQTALEAGVTTLCRCWRVERSDGAVFGFTNHDRQLSFDSVDYEPMTGFLPSEAETSLGLAVDTVELAGALSSDKIVPGDIALGLWDNAEVTEYMVDWANVADRFVFRAGSIGEVMRGETFFSAELRGLAHILNQQQGRTYQRQCDAVLGDGRCGFDLETVGFAGAGTVTAVLDDAIVTAAGLDDFDPGWFAFGVLTWTSGANVGASIEVRRHAVDDGVVRLTLWQPAALAIAVNDTFDVVAGCDKTFETCKAKFDNTDNFRGFPHIPGNDFALGVAKKDESNDGGSFFN